MNLVAAVVSGVLIAWHVLADEQHTRIVAERLSAQNRANLLDHFVKSVERAEPALHWIRQQSAIVEKVRNKRNALEVGENFDEFWSDYDGRADMDNSDDSNDVVGGEAWYNSFRKSECSGRAGAFCSSFRGESVQVKAEQSGQNAEVDWFETYKNFGNNITLDDVMPTADFNTNPNVATASTDNESSININEMLDNPENAQKIPMDSPEVVIPNFPPNDYPENVRSYRHLEDQLETTRNDLSHEAQYKLSKNEQDHSHLNRSHRRKRSATIDTKRKGYPVEILAGSSNGFSPEFLSALADNARPDISDYEEEDVDDEPDIENTIANETPITETCSNETLNSTGIPAKTTVQAFLLRNVNRSSSNISKPQIGITLEVKVNNITRQRIQTLDDLRRRKKDTVLHHRRTANKKDDNIDDLVSGKIPSDLVNAVFEMVRSNERLAKHIGPLININAKVDVFEREGDAKKSQAKLKANGLMTQIMSSMNDIIREQVNEQTCVELRPDLQHYVDGIRAFYEQQKLSRRQDDKDYESGPPKAPVPKRHAKHKRSPYHQVDFDRNTFARSCNHETIREKYIIIVGLLDQYERLSPPERTRVVEQKRYLDNHLQLLDDLESFVKRMLSSDAFDETRVKKDVIDGRSSGRFNKLVRTVEVMRKNTLMDNDQDADNGFDNEY